MAGLDAAWAATRYEGTARDLVAALKFRGRLRLARRAAAAIAERAPAALLAGAIVPVPAAPWRLRVRGHDPAEEIAFALADLTRLEFRPCLARSSGPRQVGAYSTDRSDRDPTGPRARRIRSTCGRPTIWNFSGGISTWIVCLDNRRIVVNTYLEMVRF